MAFEPVVLVTSLQELMPGFSETFTYDQPMLGHVIEKGQKRRAQGPWMEFGLVPGGPGQVTDVGKNPNAVIAGGRRQNERRGKAYAATLVYAYDVPGMDLRQANGEQDLLGLIKRYPERAMSDFKIKVGKQLAMGNESRMSSLVTLNGDATYDPAGAGSENGVFEFAPKASQSNQTFGVNKNAIEGWNHGYGVVSSFAVDGRRTMLEIYYETSQQGENGSDVDLMFADAASYINYLDDLSSATRVGYNEVSKGDDRPSNVRKGVPFLGGQIYLDRDIAIADFTTADAQRGVVYGISSDTWHLFGQGSDSNMETAGDFSQRGPIRIPTQDAWRYEYVLSMGLFCDDLRRNFVITGTATR